MAPSCYIRPSQSHTTSQGRFDYVRFIGRWTIICSFVFLHLKRHKLKSSLDRKWHHLTCALVPVGGAVLQVNSSTEQTLKQRKQAVYQVVCIHVAFFEVCVWRVTRPIPPFEVCVTGTPGALQYPRMLCLLLLLPCFKDRTPPPTGNTAIKSK